MSRENLSDNLPKRNIIIPEEKIMICKPITFGIISSGYGNRISPITGKKEFHKGIDIYVAGNPTTVPVYAAKDGIIKWIDLTRVYDQKTGAGSFGVVCYILGKDGWYSIYPHQDSLLGTTQIGKFVKAGTQLGIMGNTGMSKGRHLHYQEGLTMGGNGETREPIDIIQLYLNA